MNLVIYGNNNITTLLSMVEKYFLDIPNKNLQPPIPGPTQPFTGHLGRVIIYELKSNHFLNIYWQTPSLDFPPRNKIVNFIDYLLHSEHQGSLNRALVHRGLAINIDLGFPYQRNYFYLFRVRIELTEKGLAHTVLVLQLVFDYIAVLKKMSWEEYKVLWKNFMAMEEVNYEYNMKYSIQNSDDLRQAVNVRQYKY